MSEMEQSQDTPPTAGDATPPSDPGPRGGGGWSARVSRYGFLGIFLAFAVFFSVQTDAFLGTSNLVNVLEGSVVLLVAALGMTLVVASGGIDLSIGIAIDIGGWVAIIAMMQGTPWPVAVLIGIASAAVFGAVNSFLVVKLGVSPFLATLGTFFIGGSIQRIRTNGGGNVAFREMPDGYRAVATGDTLGIPNEIILGILIVGVFYVLLERSIHGTRIHAIGLQSDAARVAGIRVGRYLALVFIIAAATAAFGGIVLTAGLRQFTPLAGFAYLLDAIAAVFIGASLHPRQRPNVPGTVVGVLFLGMISNGLNLMGLDFNFRDAVEGLILVGALAFAVSQRRLVARFGGDT